MFMLLLVTGILAFFLVGLQGIFLKGFVR